MGNKNIIGFILLIMLTVSFKLNYAQEDDRFNEFFDRFRVNVSLGMQDSILNLTNFPFYWKSDAVYTLDRGGIIQYMNQLFFNPAVKDGFVIARLNQRAQRSSENIEIHSYVSRLGEDYIFELTLVNMDDQTRFIANYFFKSSYGVFKFYKYVH
jgi:hypothetical protein